MNPEKAACSCSKRIDTAIALGRIDPDNLEFATHAAERGTEEMEELFDAAGLMRSHPDCIAPTAMTERISGVIRSGRYEILEG